MPKYVFFSDLPKGWQQAIILAADKGRDPAHAFADNTAPIAPVPEITETGFMCMAYIFAAGIVDAKDKGII